MSNTKKNIAVNFVAYEPYETFPDVVAHLGNVSIDELQKIMNAFNTRNFLPNACIYTMNLEYNDHVRFGRLGGTGNRFLALNLSDMFYFDTMPHCGKQTKYELDEVAKIKRCARNLKNGKCCDEFIRKTLGAILFPQHYAMEKQK